MIKPETVALYFERLKVAIDKQNQSIGFFCENGTNRHDVSADEFMLMDIGPYSGIARFKHRATRNYVALELDNTLTIPCTDEAFNRGTFDSFKMLEMAQ